MMLLMPDNKIYTVRFTPYRQKLAALCARQTKGRALMSLDGRYRFYIDGAQFQNFSSSNFDDNDGSVKASSVEADDAGRHIENADFWVVQGKGLRTVQTCKVAPQNTIFLATEPASVLVYPHDYLRQFGVVDTCQPAALRWGNSNGRPKVVMGPPVLPWFVGYDYPTANGWPRITLDYDNLCASPFPKKEKLLSVITSDKAFTKGHINRLRFVEKLKDHYGNRVDIYGHGFRPVKDKWEALAPYKYHIVIENSSEPYYWTEKLSDCLLAGTFPLYYGCTNVDDYIPRQSYEPIDILRPDDAFAVIDRAVSEDLWTKRKDALAAARRLMLDEYNMFEQIARLCDGLNASLPKQAITLRPCRSGHSLTNLWRYALGRKLYELKWKIQG